MVFKIRTLSLPRTKEELLVVHGSPLKRFSWKELKSATDNFSSKNIVGRGGFGSVYRGRLADGSLVAIKRCTKMDGDGAELQFQAEVELGSSQASDHPNILRLRGYCMTRTERLLVYPLMVNRGVHLWLHDRPQSDPPLDWPTRKRIALGTAKGLAHFHYGSSFTVIHLDIKAANILLDDQFEAVLCDFGLVKFIGKNKNECNSNWVQRPRYADEVPYEEDEEEESDHENYCFTRSCWNFTRAEDGEEARGRTKWSCWVFPKNEVISENIAIAQAAYHDFDTHVFTNVRGTIGHIAPEYLSFGKCSIKSDVYGYGSMLLELISGQKSYDLARLANNGDIMLLDWVKERFGHEKLDLLVDPDMNGDYINEEMKQLIQLALFCTKTDPEERPVMSEVIKIIENLGKHPLLSRENDLSVQRFSFQQLQQATYNFSNKNVIGKSGFSNVYRGRLQEDGSTVVVKRLVKRSKRGRMQFQAEVKLGGMISGRHPNLLQLHGYCVSGNERLLVYPFMANRSLEWRLRPEHILPMDWRTRMQIALGVAKGIDYMQYDCESNIIIGRDIKPYNILLDDEFNPVICNLRLLSSGSSQENDNQDSSSDHTVIGGTVSSVDDVYGYGIILFVLISGKVSTGLTDRRSFYNDSVLHDWFKNRRLELNLLVDPGIQIGCSYSGTIDIIDEIEQLIQVALLCTQPSPADRPEICDVLHMLQGIYKGDLKVCFPFDRANLFRFDESFQPHLFHEVELGALMDSPELDSDSDQTNEVQLRPKQDSKGKEVASLWVRPGYNSKAQRTKPTPQYEGIVTISDNVMKPTMDENWEIFLSKVVSDALPSAGPLCPMCNACEEDSFHLFFKCDFSRQAWLLAMGVRIDMFGFGSVKEAVDAILTPNGAGLNILPEDVEPSRFTHKGAALMHSIWIHRNQVCSDNVSPNVIQMLKDRPDASGPYIMESGAEVATLAADGCRNVDSDLELSQEIEPAKLQQEEAPKPQVLADCVKCEQEIEPAQRQPERVLGHKGLELEDGMNKKQEQYLQVKIMTSGGVLLSLKFNKPSVWSVVLVASLCMNVLLVWLWPKPRDY